MAKASKRPRADATSLDPPEQVEAAAKRSRAAQPRPPLPQQQDEAANAPVRDRREVMADVARRYAVACLYVSAQTVKVRQAYRIRCQVCSGGSDNDSSLTTLLYPKAVFAECYAAQRDHKEVAVLLTRL